MKALIKIDAKKGLQLEDIGVPEVGENDVLIKVSKTAICGIDLSIYRWDPWIAKKMPLPMVLGREFVGTIETIGKGVKKFSIGDIVTAERYIACGVCRNCISGRRHLCSNTIDIGIETAGACAEYVRVPVENVFLIPPGIDKDSATIFNPFSNATNALRSFDVVGEDILIMGAGPLGLMSALIAQKIGARYVAIADINEYRLDLARALGITHAFNPTQKDPHTVVKELNMRHGFDIGIETTGDSAAFNTLLDVTYHGGKISMLGLIPNETSVPWKTIISKSLTLKGIYGSESFDTWYKASGMLLAGLNASSIITHHFPIDRYEEAFQVALSQQCGKVILDWE